MTSRLPLKIREAMIRVCGKAFWYKDPLKSLLLQRARSFYQRRDYEAIAVRYGKPLPPSHPPSGQ